MPGGRMLSSAIDEKADTSPERIWAETILSVKPLKKLTMTYERLSSAVSYTASLIIKCTGPRTPDAKQLNLWYSGPSDLRFIVFLLAASKVGHTALFISPRNSILAHQRLLDATSCQYVFASDCASIPAELQQDLVAVPMPTLVELFEQSRDVKRYPNRPYEEAKDDAFVILHTSGSTNHPKPISIPCRAVPIYNEWPNLPTPSEGGERLQDFQFVDGQRLFCAFPLFHKAGIDVVHESFAFDFTLVFPPPDEPPSASLLSEVLRHGLSDAGVLPPSVLQDFVAAEDDLDLLTAWKHVGTGGAALETNTGDAIQQRTKLRNLLGTTETGYLPELLLHKSPEDWAYHCYHPSLGIQYEYRGDDMYEAVVVRRPELSRFQLVFAIYPELQEFPTSDLYSKHPSKDDLWLYRGRADNIVTLSNGEKFSPDEVDSMTSSRPEVDWAMTVGEARAEAGLLLMPVDGNTEDCSSHDFLAEIAGAMNKLLPSHAFIDVEHINVLNRKQIPEMPRSVKGQIQRKRALESLVTEIETLYKKATTSASSTGPSIDMSDIDSIAASLRLRLQNVCPNITVSSNDADLFAMGVHSLSATRFARSIKTALEHATGRTWSEVTTPFIYAHGTLLQLARQIYTSCQSPQSHSHSSEDVDFAEVKHQIFDKLDAIPLTPPSAGSSVILTGSTGSLGCFILHELMCSRRFATIYCLNRRSSSDASSHQKQVHEARNLSTDFPTANVIFLQADLSEEFFGLQHDTYHAMMLTVNSIIHNAWLVNWSAPTSAFTPLLNGCAALSKFAQESPRHPHIVFLSSVGAARSWKPQAPAISPGNCEDKQTVPQSIPERAIPSPTAAEPTSYSRSKLAAEHIFAHAAKRLGVRVTICRVGQIAGPTEEGRGRWSNLNEWFPSLVQASVKLGVWPENLGALDRLDWVPIDELARCVVELVGGDGGGGEGEGDEARCAVVEVEKDTDGEFTSTSISYIHLVHPHPTSWNLIGPTAVSSAFTTTSSPSPTSPPKFIPLPTWLSHLSKACAKDASLSETSAAQLLPFYESIVSEEKARRFETEKARRRCPRLDRMEEIREKWLGRWIRGCMEG